MKKLLTFLLLLAWCHAFAQIDTTITLDLLRAPASPASNLVGISANEIQKPTMLKDFTVSLQKATDNFSTIPSNFAVDLAPFMLGKVQKVRDLLADNIPFGQQFKNSLVLSFASKTSSDRNADADSTLLGIGFRFSILQGKVDTEVYQSLNEIYQFMDESNRVADSINMVVDSIYNNTISTVQIRDTQVKLRRDLQSPAIIEDAKKAIQIKIDSLIRVAQLVKDSIRAALPEAFRLLQTRADSLSMKAFRKLESFKIRRYGFNMDLASGLALGFPGNRFDNGHLSKYATWLTFGWSLKNGFSVLGLVRHQYNPEHVFADAEQALTSRKVNTLDGGLRLDISGKQNSKFSFNGEFIYRSVLNSNIVKPSWRAVLNLNYEIRKNYLLAFSFGRDFDKKIYKDGNVMAAINLIAGFGNPQSR